MLNPTGGSTDSALQPLSSEHYAPVWTKCCTSFWRALRRVSVKQRRSGQQTERRSRWAADSSSRACHAPLQPSVAVNFHRLREALTCCGIERNCRTGARPYCTLPRRFSKKVSSACSAFSASAPLNPWPAPSRVSSSTSTPQAWRRSRIHTACSWATYLSSVP